mgnify:CR=1 FL=1
MTEKLNRNLISDALGTPRKRKSIRRTVKKHIPARSKERKKAEESPATIARLKTKYLVGKLNSEDERILRDYFGKDNWNFYKLMNNELKDTPDSVPPAKDVPFHEEAPIKRYSKAYAKGGGVRKAKYRD